MNNLDQLQQKFSEMISQYYDKMCAMTNNINSKKREVKNLSIDELIEYDDGFKKKTIFQSIIAFLSESTIYSIFFVFIFLMINKMFLGITSVIYPSLGVALLVMIDRFCCNKKKTNDTINKHYKNILDNEYATLMDQIASLEKEQQLTRSDLESLKQMQGELTRQSAVILSQLGLTQLQDMPTQTIEQLLDDKRTAYGLVPANNH